MGLLRHTLLFLTIPGFAWAGDVFENDNSPLTASLLSGGQQVGTLAAPDDQDWIFLNAERDLCEGILTYQTTVRVESLVLPPPDGFHPRIEIYDTAVVTMPDLVPQRSTNCSAPTGNAELVYFTGLESRLFRISSCGPLAADVPYRFSLAVDYTCTLQGPPPVVTGGTVTAQGEGPVGVALITNFGELTFSEKADGSYSMLGAPDSIALISDVYEAEPAVPVQDPDFPQSYTADLLLRRIGSVFTDGFESLP